MLVLFQYVHFILLHVLLISMSDGHKLYVFPNYVFIICKFRHNTVTPMLFQVTFGIKGFFSSVFQRFCGRHIEALCK